MPSKASGSEPEEGSAESSEPTASDQAIIANSIRIQGEVTGDEDLTI